MVRYEPKNAAEAEVIEAMKVLLPIQYQVSLNVGVTSELVALAYTGAAFTDVLRDSTKFTTDHQFSSQASSIGSLSERVQHVERCEHSGSMFRQQCKVVRSAGGSQGRHIVGRVDRNAAYELLAGARLGRMAVQCRTSTVCVANCPNGSAFFVLPDPDDMPDLIPYFTPTPRLSPTLEHARTGTMGGYLVGIPMYMAIQPAEWHDLVARAEVNGQFIEVIAHPIRLDFTIGGEQVSCNGPGEIVTGANWRTTTSTCRHLFTVRGDATLTMTIVYAHTYTSNFATVLPVGETGHSPTITETLPVVESQVIITHID